MHVVILVFIKGLKIPVNISCDTFEKNGPCPLNNFYEREEGNMGLFITLVPKVFFNNIFITLAEQLWGLLMNLN